MDESIKIGSQFPAIKAETIIHRLNKEVLSIQRDKWNIRVSISFGASEITPTDTDTDIDQLMHRADVLLYEMKSRKDNQSPALLE
jgi:PleD family two-component response regulator